MVKFIELVHLRNKDKNISLERKRFNPLQVSIIEPISVDKAKAVFETAVKDKEFYHKILCSDLRDVFEPCRVRGELTAVHTNGFCYYVLGSYEITTCRLEENYIPLDQRKLEEIKDTINSAFNKTWHGGPR